MTKEGLENEYFEWIYRLVQYWGNDISYRKLLQFLHSQKFYYLIPMDENRYVDGINLRYLFGDVKCYPHTIIANLLDDRDCSVLEMMAALSNRCENDIMANSFGDDDQTGMWFWHMLVSLGLSRMDDRHFDQRLANDILNRFLERQYEPNGRGGLFTLKRPKRDLRSVEIWCQLMWHINEVLDEENLYE